MNGGVLELLTDFSWVSNHAEADRCEVPSLAPLWFRALPVKTGTLEYREIWMSQAYTAELLMLGIRALLSAVQTEG